MAVDTVQEFSLSLSHTTLLLLFTRNVPLNTVAAYSFGIITQQVVEANPKATITSDTHYLHNRKNTHTPLRVRDDTSASTNLRRFTHLPLTYDVFQSTPVDIQSNNAVR